MQVSQILLQSAYCDNEIYKLQYNSYIAFGSIDSIFSIFWFIVVFFKAFYQLNLQAGLFPYFCSCHFFYYVK